MTTVGFVGVGVMGAPMSRNLMKGGHEVRAYDVSRQALSTVETDGAVGTATPAEAAAGSDIVISMLPTGTEVGAAVFGTDGIAEGISKDALYVDMSTILPMDTDKVAAECAEAGISFVDAPVGRLSKNAEDGTLMIMVGGTNEDVERARPLFELMGDTIIHCGPVGMGSRMKVVNNYMATSLNALTAETLTLAEKSGLEVDLAIEVMSGTMAGRGHMTTTYPLHVLKGNLAPGFMVDLAHKDMGLGLDMAAALRSPTAVGAAARQVYTLAQAEGRGREDWTSLYQTVRGLAGLK